MNSTQQRTGSRLVSSVEPRPLGGKVYVEKGHILEDLITDVESTQRSTKYHRKDKTELDRSFRHTDQANTRHNNNTQNPLETMRRQRHPPNPHAEALELERERKDRQFPRLLERVDKANAALEEVDKELRLFDETKYIKTRRQFEEWNTNVHGEIVRKIQEDIEKTSSKALNKKKNSDYEKFLEVTNRKPSIFRDIIIESEYDPLEPNRRCIKANTTQLKDPVKISELKAKKEAAMLGGPAPKKVPLGKDTLDVQLWAAGQIEATPYGTFAKMMNKKSGGETKRGDSAHGDRNATLRSNIHMDHFQFPRGKAAIDAEMPKGKRIHPGMVYSDPGRIFGTLPSNVEREIATIHPPENRPNFFG